MSGKLTIRERSKALALRHERKLEPIVRRSLAGATGGAIGFLEHKGILPIEVGGVPTKPVLALVGTLIELNTRGMMRKSASAFADACAAVYAFEAARDGKLIAG